MSDDQLQAGSRVTAVSAQSGRVDYASLMSRPAMRAARDPTPNVSQRSVLPPPLCGGQWTQLRTSRYTLLSARGEFKRELSLPRIPFVPPMTRRQPRRRSHHSARIAAGPIILQSVIIFEESWRRARFRARLTGSSSTAAPTAPRLSIFGAINSGNLLRFGAKVTSTRAEKAADPHPQTETTPTASPLQQS